MTTLPLGGGASVEFDLNRVLTVVCWVLFVAMLVTPR